jgi:hypothetical protein
MSDFTNITASAMSDSIDYMQVNEITYKGVTVFGVCSEKTSEQISYGGFEKHFTGAARIMREGFPQPVIGDHCIANGIERRIISYDENPIAYLIHFEDITR